MITINLEDEYTAEKIRSGESSRGAWQLIIVKDEKNARRCVSIWANNKPVNLQERGKFRITKITNVKYGARLNANTNRWMEEVSLDADIEPTGFTNADNGFDDIEGIEDCPFTVGDDPFSSAGDAFGGGEDPFAVIEELPL